VLIRVKDAVIGLFVLVTFGALIVMVYHFEMEKGYRDLAKRIVGLSSKKGGPPETIDGLKNAIALYERQIDINVKTGAQTGVYWKILAIRLADKGMHKDALEAFDRALYYKADDPTIFFLTGESASVAAASTLEFKPDSSSERERYQNLAESAYLRAIELDPTYAKPKLGLGILYTFDLDRPADAVPHLDRYLQIMPNDIRGMFVLARAYYMTENNDRAVDLYNRIISRSKDPKVKAEAQNNIEIIRNML
jgi:tetratricopeptide (TPR) repeat protein